MTSAHVISHIDLDAFYAQVEEKMHPHLAGKSIAVLQYNPFGDLKPHAFTEDRIDNSSNGSIIALGYGAARAAGVKRNMRAAEARKLCPELQLVTVPVSNGKSDLTNYRHHGQLVLDVLARAVDGIAVVAEKASIDESYLDLTAAARHRLQAQGPPWLHAPINLEQIHVGLNSPQAAADADATAAPEQLSQGAMDMAQWLQRPASDWSTDEQLLAHGAAIIAEKRAAVHAELGFTVSAGVAHTKLMAKLCSGLHKPNQQTVLPALFVPRLLHDLPLGKLRGLGGQYGTQVQEQLGISTAGDLASIPLQRLQRAFGDESGQSLYDMARGQDHEPVKPRTLPKSIGCGKTFTAHLQIKSAEKAQYWMQQLASEMEERLGMDAAENKRNASLLTMHFSFLGGHKSKASSLQRHDAATIASLALAYLQPWMEAAPKGWAITGMSLSAGNFHSAAVGTGSIKRMFARQQTRPDEAGSSRDSQQHTASPPAQTADQAQLRSGSNIPAVQPQYQDDMAQPSEGAAPAPSQEASPLPPHTDSCQYVDGRGAAAAVCSGEHATEVSHAKQPMQDAAQQANDRERDQSAEVSPPGADAQRAPVQQTFTAAADSAATSTQAATAARPAAVQGEPDGTQTAQQSDGPHAQCPSPQGARCVAAGSAHAHVQQKDNIAGDNPESSKFGQCVHGEAGHTDALVLAQLPPELRAEVYLQSRKAQKTAAAAKPKAAQKGMSAFLRR